MENEHLGYCPTCGNDIETDYCYRCQKFVEIDTQQTEVALTMLQRLNIAAGHPFNEFYDGLD